MAGDVITADLSARAKRTLGVLIQRRDQVDAREGRPSADDALERLAAATAAIDEVWSEGARRVDELQREAERVRDETRAKAAGWEAEQASALLELAAVWPTEDLAVLLGVPVEQVTELVKDAERQVVLPLQRTQTA